jgi:hypothetical protein
MFYSENITIHNVQALDYPTIEVATNNVVFSSSPLKTTLNSVPDTTMFNLMVYGLAIVQEFVPDNNRMGFSAGISDNFTSYILELVICITLLLIIKLRKLNLIKC